MAIPEKNANEPSQIRLTLQGEIKKAVIEKRDEIRALGINCSKELATQKIIREWYDLKSKKA